MPILLATAYLAHLVDLVTFLQMGRKYEVNPAVLTLSTEEAVIAKFALLAFISLFACFYWRMNKYTKVVNVVLSVAFVGGWFAAFSNTLVLVALEVVR